MPRGNLKRKPRPAEIRTGTGAMCPESQADGVPCPTLNRDCEDCSRAVSEDRRDPDRPPAETA
jgi:hypothetical protein